MILEVGKTYENLGSKRTIVNIEKHPIENIIFYKKDFNSVISKTTESFFLKYFANNFKPLDQAFKELDKKICSHHNVREDRFFSIQVYRTCKDCGKALN